MQLDNVIDGILLNAPLCYVIKVLNDYVRVIMADLNRCFAKYLEYDEHQPDLINVFMENSSLQISNYSKVNFLSTLQNLRGHSMAGYGARHKSMIREKACC